jgi:hypothetical protein
MCNLNRNGEICSRPVGANHHLILIESFCSEGASCLAVAALVLSHFNSSGNTISINSDQKCVIVYINTYSQSFLLRP